MAQMIRKQVYIPKNQVVLLKRLAKARGVSEAEIIREAIAQKLNGGSARFFRRDPEAWEKAYRFMLSRRTLARRATRPYQWKREDAYEERLSRFDRKSK